MAEWTALYHDPKRTQGVAHSLHVRGCADVGWALKRDRSGLANAIDFEAPDLASALIWAQYHDFVPDEHADLGDVDPAPCATKVQP